MFNFISYTYKENRFAFVETIGMLLLYLAIGYAIDPNDTLMISSDIIFLMAFISIITLFYGMINGLLIVVILSIVMFVLYDKFEYYTLLKALIFVLVLGKFHEMWSYSLRQAQTEKELLSDKLYELGTRFYALKLSHDQLELNYILKPVSLRKMMLEIINGFKDNSKSHAEIVTLIAKTYNIHRMSICDYSDGKCEVQASYGENSTKPTDDDPLIRHAVEESSIVYISDHVEEETPYLAVIPIVLEKEIKAMILIEDMPFMSFTENNIISLSFLIDIFYMAIHRREMLEYNNIMKEFGVIFRFDYTRIYSLYNKFKVDSAVLVFKTNSELAAHQLNEVYVSMQRGLDTYGTVEHNGVYFTLILTPLSIDSSANVLKERILDSLDTQSREKLEYSTFNISQHTLIREYMGLDNDK